MNGKTILTVDDDTKVLLALHKRLTSAGYRVLSATDARGAVDLAREELPDAISLDVRLPGDQDGLAVAATLQQDPRTARIPIIFVTGSADQEFKAKCQAVGGRYFLSKPYDSDLLLQVLRGVFATDELAEIQRLSSAKRRQPVGANR